MQSVSLTLIFGKILKDINREAWGPPENEAKIVETSMCLQEQLSESVQPCQPNFISHVDRLLDKETEFNRPSVRNLQESLKIFLRVI